MLLVLLQVVLPIMSVVRTVFRHGDAVYLLLHLLVKQLWRNHGDLWCHVYRIHQASQEPDSHANQDRTEAARSGEELLPGLHACAACQMYLLNILFVRLLKLNPSCKLSGGNANRNRVLGCLAGAHQVHGHSSTSQSSAVTAAEASANWVLTRALRNLNPKNALISERRAAAPSCHSQGPRSCSGFSLVSQKRCNLHLRLARVAARVLDKDFLATPTTIDVAEDHR
mmetsp:Transcript_48677/g.87705  ORF Transcript_48677/g.87705 Transcript_48677/m.87705 type:complete len:226 (+) Transcript_48677:694-1371(+)